MDYFKALTIMCVGLLAQPVPAASKAPERSGVVSYVSDGDTLWVRLDGASKPPVKLRLRGIDAPEICQPGGPEARAALATRVLHRRVVFSTLATDDYHRAIVDLRVDGEGVEAGLLREGHAWAYGWGKGKALHAQLEAAARKERRGVFASGTAQEPWRFRKMHGPCPYTPAAPRASHPPRRP